MVIYVLVLVEDDRQGRMTQRDDTGSKAVQILIDGWLC